MFPIVVLVNVVLVVVAAGICAVLPASKTLPQGEGWTLKYTVRDLITLAVVTAVGAVAYTLLNFPTSAIQSTAGPVMGGIVTGLFAWTYPINYMLIRKPGAALATGVIGTLIQVLLGNPAGLYTIGWGVLLGIAFEVCFAAARYKKISFAILVVAAAAASQFQTIWTWQLYGWSSSVNQYWLSIPVVLVSGAIFAGCLGYLLGRAIQRSGLVRGAASQSRA
jgi:energy-coupling factor transport system permease protein